MKFLFGFVLLASIFQVPTSEAAFKKARLERVNVQLQLPERFVGDDWMIVEDSESGRSMMSSRIELICSISSADPFSGTTTGIVRAVALVQAKKMAPRSFQITSIDGAKRFHESKATGVFERAHDCYIQGQFNIVHQVSGKYDWIQIAQTDVGNSWKLLNEELEKIIETAYID